MQLNTIEEIIEDIRQGKMVILMDDEDRENEGDLIMAAEKVTAQDINFMATHARGLICLPMSGKMCDHLGLPPMVQSNGASHGTPFTVSIEAAEGVTTGISAADRALTIQVAVNPNSQAEDIVQPGHIFPLRAQPGGVLSRAGHTEAGCDLARIAGFRPAAAIVEIMNADGTMARRPDLEKFAEQHGLKIGTIADLIHYRMNNEHTITKMAQLTVATRYGEFALHQYQDQINGGTHLALTKGEITADNASLVRVHVGQILRDFFGIQNKESSSWPLDDAMKAVADAGNGVIVVLDSQQPFNVQAELELYGSVKQQRRQNSANQSGAYTLVGTGAQILRELGVGKMKLLSSPIRFAGISGFGLEVDEYLPYEQHK